MCQKTNYFQKETDDVLNLWSGRLKHETIPGKPNWRQLTSPLPCGNSWIPKGYKWNGASSGILRPIFPKWKHPIATCRHDFRCERSFTWKDRRIADRLFVTDAGINGNLYDQATGYVGVTIGAFWQLIRGKYAG